MLRTFDASMPKDERLGEYLDAVEERMAEIELGDEVWVETANGRKALLVMGFAERPVPLSQGDRRLEHSPYVVLCERDGDYTWNPNNFPKGDVLRVRWRA